MTIEPHFHKLLLANGHQIPIKAVVKDKHDDKKELKFRYIESEQDHENPGTLEPHAFWSDDDTPAEWIQIASDAIELHTTYDVRLKRDTYE